MPNPRSLRTLSVSSNVNKHTNTGHGPPSPTFSDATNASAMNFGSNGPEKIITRADLKASLQAYDDVRTRTFGCCLMSQMNLSEPVGGGFGLAFKRLCKLSYRPDVPVEGDLAFRRRNGSLFEVRPSLNSLFPHVRTRTPQTYRLKGPSYETSTRIQGASGLHHLMGNQWHIMVCTPTSSVFYILTRSPVP